MSDDLVKQICSAWIADGMSNDCFWEGWPECPTPEDSLTPRMVADRIEELEAEIKLHEECATIVHFQGVMYARDNMADAIWAEFKDRWEGEKKFALREVVKYLRGGKDE